MLRQRGHLIRAGIIAGDAVAMGMAFLIAYHLGGPLSTRLFGARVVLPIERYLWVLAAAVPIGWACFALMGAYDLARFERWIGSLHRLAAPVFVHAGILAAIVFFSKEPFFARRVIGLFLVLNLPCIALVRDAIMWLITRTGLRPEGTRRILLIGGGQGATRFLDWARVQGWGLHIVGALADQPPSPDVRLLGKPADVGAVLDHEVVDDVIVSEPTRDLDELREVIRKCEEVGVIVHIQSDFFEAALSRPHVESVDGLGFLTFSPTPYQPIVLAIKRFMDIVGSGVLLVPSSLLMLYLACRIKWSSPGPIFFRQERCGLNGRRFRMVKFRSMVAGAEAMRDGLEKMNERDGPAFKIENDPRVTTVGRWMRKYSLDELPQLWNVLRGDMGLVGPRPPLPSEVARYERWQRRRLSMRPGLTGLGQIRGRHRLGFDEWMKCDLEYIDTWSLWLDFRILVKTIPAALRGSGV